MDTLINRHAGLGHGILEGHHLIISDGKAIQVFEVLTIEYKRDPKDMWNSTVKMIGQLEEHEIESLNKTGDYRVAA